MIKTIYITGESGLLGSNLSKLFLQNTGYKVYGLCRKPKYNHQLAFSLANEFNWPTNQNAFLIHSAWSFGLSEEESKKINIDGSIRLLKSALSNGIRPIFVSSASAHKDAKSIYGRHKYLVEQFCKENDILFIRPGLIIYDDKGFYNNLIELGQKNYLVPLVGDGQQPQYVIKIADLLEIFNLFISRPEQIVGKLNDKLAAYSQPINVKIILKFASIQKNKKIIFVYIPAIFFKLIFSLFAILRIPFPFSTDSLLGLIHYPKNSVCADLNYLQTQTIVEKIIESTHDSN